MKERNSSIDAVKGIAIVLVMIGHVFVHNHMEDPYVYDVIKAVQMPLFMLISGYLCGHGRIISDVSSYRTVMKKRAVSYLVPFFAWLTLMHWRNLPEAYHRIFTELDYGLWFLAVLFLLTWMVYTAQLLAGRLRKRHKWLSEAVFWSVYGCFCLVLVCQILTGNNFLSPYLIIIYVPFYMAGYVTGHYGMSYLCWGTGEAGKIDCKNSRWIRAAAVIMGILFLYLAAAFDLNSMESKLDTLLQMTASVFGSGAIIYGVLWWKEGKIKNIFAKIGRYTLEIYVIHYHFANMLHFQDRVYDFYTLQGFFFVVASFIAMSAATFCVIWLMKKVRILDFLFFGMSRSAAGGKR